MQKLVIKKNKMAPNDFKKYLIQREMAINLAVDGCSAAVSLQLLNRNHKSN